MAPTYLVIIIFGVGLIHSSSDVAPIHRHENRVEDSIPWFLSKIICTWHLGMLSIPAVLYSLDGVH